MEKHVEISSENICKQKQTNNFNVEISNKVYFKKFILSALSGLTFQVEKIVYLALSLTFWLF